MANTGQDMTNYGGYKGGVRGAAVYTGGTLVKFFGAAVASVPISTKLILDKDKHPVREPTQSVTPKTIFSMTLFSVPWIRQTCL